MEKSHIALMVIVGGVLLMATTKKEPVRRRKRNPTRQLRAWGVNPDYDGTGPRSEPLYRNRRNPSRTGLYESFHGASPSTRTVNLPVPKQGESLVAIGYLEQIRYRPYGNSTRKAVICKHDAGDTGSRKVNAKTILATDEKGRNLYIVPQHPTYPKFTDRGIIG